MRALADEPSIGANGFKKQKYMAEEFVLFEGETYIKRSVWRKHLRAPLRRRAAPAASAECVNQMA
jgi:hypothetical protein